MPPALLPDALDISDNFGTLTIKELNDLGISRTMTDGVEELTNELLAILPLLIGIVAAEVRREAGEATTMPQYRVLAHLAAQPLTLSGLAKQRRVSLQAMSELVQALVERGWVVRVPDPRDRRQQMLHLTEQGRQRYERAQHQTLQRLIPLMSQLDETERVAVRQALLALRRVLAGEENEPSDGH